MERAEIDILLQENSDEDVHVLGFSDNCWYVSPGRENSPDIIGFNDGFWHIAPNIRLTNVFDHGDPLKEYKTLGNNVTAEKFTNPKKRKRQKSRSCLSAPPLPSAYPRTEANSPSSGPLNKRRRISDTSQKAKEPEPTVVLPTKSRKSLNKVTESCRCSVCHQLFPTVKEMFLHMKNIHMAAKVFGKPNKQTKAKVGDSATKATKDKQNLPLNNHPSTTVSGAEAETRSKNIPYSSLKTTKKTETSNKKKIVTSGPNLHDHGSINFSVTQMSKRLPVVVLNKIPARMLGSTSRERSISPSAYVIDQLSRQELSESIAIQDCQTLDIPRPSSTLSIAADSGCAVDEIPVNSPETSKSSSERIPEESFDHTKLRTIEDDIGDIPSQPGSLFASPATANRSELSQNDSDDEVICITNQVSKEIVDLSTSPTPLSTPNKNLPFPTTGPSTSTCVVPIFLNPTVIPQTQFLNQKSNTSQSDPIRTLDHRLQTQDQGLGSRKSTGLGNTRAELMRKRSLLNRIENCSGVSTVLDDDEEDDCLVISTRSEFPLPKLLPVRRTAPPSSLATIAQPTSQSNSRRSLNKVESMYKTYDTSRV